MRVLYPGHRYALKDSKSASESILQFRQDGLHPLVNGPSCQEVIRALIDRVNVLNEEVPWSGNETILQNLRNALAGFEARALLRKVEKGMQIERISVADDGHLTWRT